MTSCGHEHEDGAYVLGALSPDDRVAFERHLPGCPACSQSVRELAGLPGLLARVPVELFDPAIAPTPVPDTLLPTLVRRVQRTQRRRRWVTGGLVAAAVTIGAVAVTTLVVDDGNPTNPPAVATAPAKLLHQVGTPPISGWLSLTKVGWGTRLDLTCSYAETSYPGQPNPVYSMVVIHADGTAEQVASWEAIPGKTLHLTGATSAKRADIADVEVRTSSGRTVLELS